MSKYLRNIHPLFISSNITTFKRYFRQDRHQWERLELLMLSSSREKSGRLNYHGKYEELLIFALSKILGGHDLPLNNHAISDQFQLVLKATKCWNGNNNINKTSYHRYFHKVNKIVKNGRVSMKSKQEIHAWGNKGIKL